MCIGWKTGLYLVVLLVLRPVQSRSCACFPAKYTDKIPALGETGGLRDLLHRQIGFLQKPAGSSQSGAASQATPEPSEKPQASATPAPTEAPQEPTATATPEQAQAESTPAMNPLLVVLIVAACLAAAVLIGVAVLRFRSR